MSSSPAGRSISISRRRGAAAAAAAASRIAVQGDPATVREARGIGGSCPSLTEARSPVTSTLWVMHLLLAAVVGPQAPAAGATYRLAGVEVAGAKRYTAADLAKVG